MRIDESEEELLRSVALQNARAILRAQERAETALLLANRRITSILESITDGFMVLDRDFRIEFMNRRAEEFVLPLGLTKEKLIGSDYWQAFPAAIGTPLEENYRRALRDRVTLQFESYNMELDVWFEMRVYPSPDGLSVYYRDITQQKRLAEELRHQQEWFAVTLASIGDAVLATDVDGRITFINPVAEEMTGWRAHEAVGQPLVEVFHIVHERTREPADNAVVAVLNEGRSVELSNHTALISRDGREIAIEDSAAPIQDADGTVTGAVMVFHDVTDRRRAEEALRDREERLRAIFSHAAVGIAVAELDGSFTEVNQKFADILGHTIDVLEGKSFADITHPGDMEATRACMEELVTGVAENTSFEKRYQHVDGHYVLCLTTATTIKDEKGAPRQFLGVIEDITERKRAELERARLTGVLEGSLNEVYLFHTETLCYEYVNEGARRNLGYTLEEMRRKTPVDIKPEFTAAQFREMIAPLVAGGHEKLVFETLHRRRDGSDYPVEVHLQYATYMEEPVFVTVALDISERRRAEVELRRSEEQLRAMADSIPNLAWAARPDGRISWYNRRWYEYTGTTPEEMDGPGGELVHDPVLLPRVRERWAESLRTGEPMEMEFPLRGADGEFRWFLTRAVPVRDDEGRIVRWFGTNTNVDDVRRTHEALREETRTLELLNATGASIASNLDPQSLVQTVTDSATKLTGADFGAFFYNVINEEGEAFLLFALAGAPREAFEGFGHPRATPLFGPTFRGEGVIRSGDVLKDPRYGQWAPHHGMPKHHLPVRSYLAVPVIARSGEVIGGLFFGHKKPDMFTDRSERVVVGMAAQAAIAIDNARLYDAAQKEIGERVKVEQALRVAQEELGHHADNLESQVTARTASLRAALEQLEEFSYTVSHDLRAPIRAIAGYTEILFEEHGDTLPDEARWLLERVTNSAAHMARLVEDVLTLSRAASAEVTLAPVALQGFVEKVIAQDPSTQEPAAGVRVETPHVVVADEALLNQALTNLISNAVKFVERDIRPEVLVRSERVGDDVRIWIEDNGVGVRPEHRDKLFGMFQRLPTTLEYEGTGIGLALVRKAVERMGGTVGMEHAEGGSRFWIQLRGGR